LQRVSNVRPDARVRLEQQDRRPFDERLQTGLMSDGVFQKERQQTRLAVCPRATEDVLEVVVDGVLAEAESLRDHRDRA